MTSHRAVLLGVFYILVFGSLIIGENYSVHAKGNDVAYPHRPHFPETHPEVCLVMISRETETVKLDYLIQVYTKAVLFMESQDGLDGKLRYEIVWVDNGSSQAERNRFRKGTPQSEVEVMLKSNVGLCV